MASLATVKAPHNLSWLPREEAHWAWPFIPAWARGWLTLRPLLCLVCKEFTTMLLERLPRAGGQVHSEGAPQEGGWKEGEGREGVGREVPLRGEPQREGREEGAEAPQLGMHQASQGPTAQGPVP